MINYYSTFVQDTEVLSNPRWVEYFKQWGDNKMAVDLTYSIGTAITMNATCSKNSTSLHFFTDYQDETDGYATFHISFVYDKDASIVEGGITLCRIGTVDTVWFGEDVLMVPDDILETMLLSRSNLIEVFERSKEIRAIVLQHEDVLTIL